MTRSLNTDILVLGGGVSGLTLAHDLVRGGIDAALVEKQAEVGGCAQTVRKDGFLFETGPFNLLVRDPLFEDLLVQLGETLTVLDPSAGSKRRDLLFRGKLRKLPGSLGEAVTTPLLSPLQKLRLVSEPILGRKPTDPDPTLGELFRRRFGAGFARNILSAAVVGIFGGDSERLSARSCFSFFWEIDRASRSFLVGGIRRRLTSRMNTRRWRGMVSFEGGLGAFCRALAAPLGEKVFNETEVTGIEATEEGYVVLARRGGEDLQFETQRLVLGLDLPAALLFLRRLAPEVALELEAIESVGLAVINLGFEQSAFPTPPEGFGFLVPATEEEVHILGTLWASNVFPSQAPEGCLVARIFVGGVRSPEWLDLPDEELLEKSLGELSRFVDIRKPPKTVFISRYRDAVPQMYPGHADQISRVESLLEKHPALFLVGNYLHGVSVNDCVVHSRKVAARILAEEE